MDSKPRHSLRQASCNIMGFHVNSKLARCENFQGFPERGYLAFPNSPTLSFSCFTRF